jgi:hypothetical protein
MSPRKKITLEDVQSVPRLVRIKETSFYIREIAYGTQKPQSAWALDFDNVAYHALHNHYCLSFIASGFRLNFESFLSRFNWCCRCLYFNFEESVLKLEIFVKLERTALDKEKLRYMIDMLEKYPAAYQYELEDADHVQQWALLKQSKFESEHFSSIIEIDQEQRALLLEHLKKLASPAKKEKQPAALKSPISPLPGKKREREASLYKYLKLNDNLSTKAASEIIDLLYNRLAPIFRKKYTSAEFRAAFQKGDSPVIELVKSPELDNQHLTLLFRELKDRSVLSVSWNVINEKIKVFSAAGKPFSGFSDVSSGKISISKRNKVKQWLKDLYPLIEKDLGPNRNK